MAKCKKCGQEIAWVKMHNGIMAAVNPEYMEIDLGGPGLITLVCDKGQVVAGTLLDSSSLFPAGNTARGRVFHRDTCPGTGNVWRRTGS